MNTLPDPFETSQIHMLLKKKCPHIPLKVCLLLAKYSESDEDGFITKQEFQRFGQTLIEQNVTESETMLKMIFLAGDVQNKELL